jgi:hypothetical protein
MIIPKTIDQMDWFAILVIEKHRTMSILFGLILLKNYEMSTLVLQHMVSILQTTHCNVVYLARVATEL